MACLRNLVIGVLSQAGAWPPSESPASITHERTLRENAGALGVWEDRIEKVPF
jgi:hypothetical protein